ncbi:MAG: Nif3-like dinuclear metal center hexameric protein [Oscillospiraceae bacterium]|nr:Nif3-like dinuclear metal center hexameric protein [Oscillospiraceae bacterium]
MATVHDIFSCLCELAPLELQMSFDNSGFLVGRGEREVHRALLSLDIVPDVIQEAADLGAELIISHHPLIFKPLKALTAGGEGEKALRMAELGISAICMHTDLDIAEGGVNDVLIRLLGAEPLEALDSEGCGRIGELPEPMDLAAFLTLCKKRLQAPGLRYVASGRPVWRLAVMGGAGGDALACAIAKGCDTYVTADVKYHVFLEAAEQKITLIDAGHFCTEQPVIPDLARRLRSRFPDVTFSVSQRHGPIVSFF